MKHWCLPGDAGGVDLSRLARALEAGADLSPSERQAAAEALRAAVVLLAPTRPGQRSASTRAAQEQRDRLIRSTVAQFFPTLPDAIAAEQLAERLGRYRSGGDWRRDRAADKISYGETLRGCCWAILRAIDRPLSARRIREILATSYPISSPRV
jgi:hypothetical protein